MPRNHASTVKAYWWNDLPNFGDRLAPLLIERFTDHDVIWERPGKSDVVSVGSVLEHLPLKYDGFILGAGRLYPDSRLNLYDGSPYVLALRGPLTAKAWKHDVVLGDPGLLASELVGAQSKTVDLGIVPHWSDSKLALDKRFFSPSWSTKVIDPTDDPLKVVAEIGQCHKIVASSLHGLIVADSFGIPRRFEPTSQFESEGGLFKFEDYSLSIGSKLVIGETVRASTRTIGNRKHELWDVYRSLNTLLGKS